VLLPEEADAIDHLLSPLARRGKTLRQPGILALEELNTFWRDDAFHSGRLERLEPRFRLERAAAKGCQLVTEMLDELLQLRECRDFRPYAV
jgi:hypothetical protein